MKKFLLLVLILTAITLPANAEQPAAEEYRQMFRSGNFYVEYQMFLPTKVNVMFQIGAMSLRFLQVPIILLH